MKKFDQINVIPFIDIMLVLLAIVIATASFIKQGRIIVNVPQSDSTIAVFPDELTDVITITQTGDFFFQDQPVTTAMLDTALAKHPKDTKITIKIDAKSDFQQFVTITDLLGKHELKKVIVITEKRH